MGNDARARFQIFLEVRLHRFIKPGQHVESHDGCRRDIGFQCVLNPKLNQVTDTFRLGAFSSFVNQCPVHLDADAASAVLLGGADDDAAVAAAQVVNS